MILLVAFASFAFVAAAPSGRLSAFNYPALSNLNTRTRAPIAFRGGNLDPTSSHAQYSAQDSEQQQNEFLTEQQLPPPDDGDKAVPSRETFLERVDKWLDRQDEEAAKEWDEQGRRKLTLSVSKATRVFTFFMLVMRDVLLHEEFIYLEFNHNLRLLKGLPLTIMLSANMVGLVASIMPLDHLLSKTRLKAILNVDKLLEVLLIIWNVQTIVKLRFSTYASAVPRGIYDIFIEQIVFSVYLLILCQTVTSKSVWGKPLPDATANQDQEELDDY